MNPAPILRTERLELRVPERADLPGLVELIAADETRRFLGRARPDEAGQFERLLRNVGGWSLYGYGNFSVRLCGHERLIGSCGVFHSWRGFGQGMDDVPEAGWIIHRDHWGQGLAREAMRAILAWFDKAHGPRRIAAIVRSCSAPSVHTSVRSKSVATTRASRGKSSGRRSGAISRSRSRRSP